MGESQQLSRPEKAGTEATVRKNRPARSPERAGTEGAANSGAGGIDTGGPVGSPRENRENREPCSHHPT